MANLKQCIRRALIQQATDLSNGEPQGKADTLRLD
jgi:hypothetical protein